jgi:hypothetical protein
MTEDANHCDDPVTEPKVPVPVPVPVDGKTPVCKPLEAGPKPPHLPDPTPCVSSCCCPTKTGDPANTCIDKIIEKQSKAITEAERAKSFKADLEDLQKKAQLAKQDYTQEKYKDLVERWKKQDAEIVELIKKLICTVDCWWCVIECEICPLLDEIRAIDIKLNGSRVKDSSARELTDKVFSLTDMRNWNERNRDAKKEVFDRIKEVLAAWEKPAVTLDKILMDNVKLVDDAKVNLANNPAAAVFAVFMKLVPMHLAIAPRDIQSNIAPEYSNFCDCDNGFVDDCCGPDVGVWSIRQRLIGPQPFLINPDKFFDIICCLAEQRYLPAKDQLASAESELAKTETDIEKAKADYAEKRVSVEARFTASVTNPIDCSKYRRKKDGKEGDDCGCKPTPPAISPASPMPSSAIR